jgi:cell shape-determining protein MreC
LTTLLVNKFVNNIRRNKQSLFLYVSHMFKMSKEKEKKKKKKTLYETKYNLVTELIRTMKNT